MEFSLRLYELYMTLDESFTTKIWTKCKRVGLELEQVKSKISVLKFSALMQVNNFVICMCHRHIAAIFLNALVYTRGKILQLL